MSCVAEPKATASAHQTIGPSISRGSARAMPTSPATTTNWDNSSQLRRRPSQRVSRGRGMRSTSGAQTHLKP